jgi:hypothetical protein
MEFTDLEIMDWRKKIYEEIQKLPQYSHLPLYACTPESKDFDRIKGRILSEMAFKIWERLGKPKDRDVEIWNTAEETWNFIRYMW